MALGLGEGRSGGLAPRATLSAQKPRPPPPCGRPHSGTPPTSPPQAYNLQGYVAATYARLISQARGGGG